MTRKFLINVFLILGVAEAQDLTIITEDYQPLSFKKEGILTGFSVEVVREILRRLKQPDSIVMLPWVRGYNLLKTQPNVALFSTTRTKERETLFQWVGPLCTSQNGFYAKKNSGIHIDSLEDAKKVGSIATYKEDVREQMFKSWGFTNLVSANKNVSNIKRLLEDKLDFWVSSDFNMPYLAQQAGVAPNQLELVYAFRKVNNYIAFSILTPDELIDSWQQTLDELKTDGTYKRLSEKYK